MSYRTINAPVIRNEYKYTPLNWPVAMSVPCTGYETSLELSPYLSTFLSGYYSSFQDESIRLTDGERLLPKKERNVLVANNRNTSKYCRHFSTYITSNQFRNEFVDTRHICTGPGYYDVGKIRISGILPAWNCDQLNYWFTPVWRDHRPSASELKHAVKRALSDQKLLDILDFSIANTIIEIKDIFRLKNLLDFKGSIAHNVSDKHLGISFGLLPLIGDIKALYDILFNLKTKIEEWNRKAASGKVYRARHKFKWSEHDDYPSFTQASALSLWGRTLGTGILKGTAYDVYRSNINIYYKALPVNPDQYDAIRKRLLGLDDPATIAWNAVPFSFVVDWFINIGSIIESLDANAALIQVQVIDACLSYKQTSYQFVDSNWDMLTGINYYGGNRTTRYEIYERTVLDPATITAMRNDLSISSDSLAWSVPSDNQALLGASLLTQIRRF